MKPGALDVLLQLSLRDELENGPSSPEWVVAYHDDNFGGRDVGVFCALIPKKLVGDCLRHPSWDLTTDHIGPGCSVRQGRGGKENVKYQRFGREDGIEPLVIPRRFHSLREPYLELLEEFRLFHNLFLDEPARRFLKFNEAGDATVVAEIIDQKSVRIASRPLRQFLSLKKMVLGVFYSVVQRSQTPIDDVPQSERRIERSGDTYCYSLHVTDDLLFDEHYRSWSILLGKRIVSALPVDDSGFWPYSERRTKKESFLEFVIGTDEDGNELTFTCDPDRLANYFGANPEAPHYLTPVHFRPDVLRKYYDDPQKYSVEDGYIRCGSLWGVSIDNHNADYVGVYLGDLGRDLPEAERLYWKSFNITPLQPRVSAVAFRRDFLAEPADPDRADLKFKYRFEAFTSAWPKKFGWELFRSPAEEDKHLLSTLRIPLSDAQPEFDQQLIILTKTLVDALNEKELAKSIPNLPPDTKGIGKLELFLQATGYGKPKDVTTFLRDLQSLRSAGAAHRKGSNYKDSESRLGVKGLPRTSAFELILDRAVEFLEQLSEFYLEKPRERADGTTKPREK